MVISPPFLPSPMAGEVESAFLARAMFQADESAQDTTARRGSYPVSAALMYHAGLHLRAPQTDRRYVPVRAVADGKVIYVRQPAAPSEDPKHPLNYTSNGDPQWTDNGCVILRHTTDIGESYGAPVTFTYYSLTMHLSAIEPAIVVGAEKETQVYRKDVLGKAGKILGSDPTVHFEIRFQQHELKKLIGREPTWIELEDEPAPTTKDGRTKNGRTDCVYGDTLIYLPAGTAIAHGKQQPSPQRVMGATQTQLNVAQWVVLKYEKGELRIRSMDRMGRKIGEASAVPDAEYNLYKTACDLHARAARPGIASSPSGWYELLRFGRNLGPDPLQEDAAHWQQVPTGQGIVWVDLNYPGTCKFSEADYLTVMGFKFISDDRDPLDQRAQSHQIDRLLQDPTPGSLEREKAGHKNQRLGLPEVMEKLKRVIFRFGTDWEKSTVAQRMAWARDKTQTDQPLGDKKWAELMAHCDMLCISDLPQEFKDAMWNISPSTFIEMMRKCSWLSRDEMVRCFRKSGVSHQIMSNRLENSAPLSPTSGGRPAGLNFAMQSMMRKYGIANSPQRFSAFISQIAEETGRLESTVEKGSDLYFHKYEPGTTIGDVLGNKIPGDGILFKGRGLIQITGRDNYFKFGYYQQIMNMDVRQADRVGIDAYLSCAAAGFYWASKQRLQYTDKRKYAPLGKMSINYWADLGVDLPKLREVTKCVNAAALHFAEVRWPAFCHAFYILNDCATVPSEFDPIKL